MPTPAAQDNRCTDLTAFRSGKGSVTYRSLIYQDIDKQNINCLASHKERQKEVWVSTCHNLVLTSRNFFNYSHTKFFLFFFIFLYSKLNCNNVLSPTSWVCYFLYLLTWLLKWVASLTAMFRNMHSVPGLGIYCKACCNMTAALWALAEIGGGEQDGSEGWIASATTVTWA